MKKTLTSANSSITISLPILPIPVQLQQFSSDDLINQDEVTLTEDRMGIDGIKSSGFILNPIVIHITLESTSPSIDNVFNLWIQSMELARESLECSSMILTVPSLNNRYTFINGNLRNAKKIADIKKTTQPITYTISFERCVVTPIG